MLVLEALCRRSSTHSGLLAKVDKATILFWIVHAGFRRNTETQSLPAWNCQSRRAMQHFQVAVASKSRICIFKPFHFVKFNLMASVVVNRTTEVAYIFEEHGVCVSVVVGCYVVDEVIVMVGCCDHWRHILELWWKLSYSYSWYLYQVEVALPQPLLRAENTKKPWKWRLALQCLWICETFNIHF